MKRDDPISFGDNVRVREVAATQAMDLAGLTGNVHGETTPSITNVEVIGDLKADYAINVYIEQRARGFWFTPDLLEFVDHAPGTEISLKGVDQKWVRLESGEWSEIPGRSKHKSFWERITGRLFKKHD